MAATEWMSISPKLTPEGAFMCLATLDGGSSLKPIPLLDGQAPFGTLWKQERQYHFSAAAQLGLAGVATTRASFASVNVTYDCARYSEVIQATPNGGFIVGTRWGAGLRARVSVMNVRASGNMSLPWIAASVSLGRLEASFEVEAFGIADRRILGLLPDPGRFDQTSFTRITKTFSTITNDYLAHDENLKAVPFMVYVRDPELALAHPMRRAQAQVCSLMHIAHEKTEAAAVEAAKQARLDPGEVVRVYRQFGGVTSATSKPSQQAVEWAKYWMDRAGLD